MKKVLKVSSVIGMSFYINALYRNHIKSVPEVPKLHTLEKKKIVIIGAGIVGLNTAYYLSKH